MNLIRKLKEKEKPTLKPKAGSVIPATDDLETSLVTAVDELLEASNGPVWKQSDTFAPSSTNQCGRYAIYRMRGFTQVQTFKGQTKRIFELGNIVEDSVGRLFDDLGILLASQIEMEIADPPVRGYIDFEIDWDGPKPVECKSINEAGFAYRKLYHKPKDEHFRQLQCYLAWGKLMGFEWDAGFLLYYSKNNSELLPLLVQRDDAFIEKLFTKYRAIHQIFKDGDTIERPYKQNSKNCSWCDAKDHCWSDTEVGVKITKK